MKWDSRPIEIANLLNPAFCALLLRDAAKAYHDYEKTGMPYILAFLLLPIALHQRTCDAVPHQPTITFGQWIERNAEVTFGFADRTRTLNPLTKEAIIFGLQHGILDINTAGEIVPSSVSLEHPSSWDSDSVPSRCAMCAKNIGRWFAEVGDASTICRLLGVRP